MCIILLLVQRPSGIRGWSSAVRAFEGGECGFEGDGPSKKRPKTTRDYCTGSKHSNASKPSTAPPNGQLLLPNTASVAVAQTPPTCTIIHSSAQSTHQWNNTCTFTSPPNLPTLHPPCGAQTSSPTISALEQATPDGITENTTDPNPSAVPVPGTTGACNWLLANRIAVFTNHLFV